jgi:hypothetical protein
VATLFGLERSIWAIRLKNTSMPFGFIPARRIMKTASRSASRSASRLCFRNTPVAGRQSQSGKETRNKGGEVTAAGLRELAWMGCQAFIAKTRRRKPAPRFPLESGGV